MVVFPEAPFPSYEKTLRNGLEQSRARGVGAAKRTLDGEDRSGTWAERERGRGFQGCPPWPDLGSAHGFACGALTGHQRRAPATALFYAATDPQIPPRTPFSKGQVREHVDRVKAGDILMMHATWFCEYAAGMLIGTRCCGIWYRKETH